MSKHKWKTSGESLNQTSRDLFISHEPLVQTSAVSEGGAHRDASSRPEGGHSFEVLIAALVRHCQQGGVGIAQLVVLIDQSEAPLVCGQTLQKHNQRHHHNLSFCNTLQCRSSTSTFYKLFPVILCCLACHSTSFLFDNTTKLHPWSFLIGSAKPEIILIVR